MAERLDVELDAGKADRASVKESEERNQRESLGAVTTSVRRCGKRKGGAVMFEED